MKTCTKCDTPKELDEFAADRRAKDGKRSACKDCGNLSNRNRYDREGRKKYREENKQEIKDYYADRLKKASSIVDGIKCSSGCCCCGYMSELGVHFDLHHVDPAVKDKSISKLTATAGMDRIYNEIAKCSVLCVMCHREFHYYERRDSEKLADMQAKINKGQIVISVSPLIPTP